MNVFEFAMQMERDAERFYRKLAEKSPVKGIRRIFEGLAEDERQHYDIFCQLKDATAASCPQESAVLAEARNIFSQMLEERVDMSVLQDNLEGYRYAIKVETEGVRYYRDAARREKDADLKKLLQRVAEEEEKHLTIVENVYRFVNAPNEYLAWVEFSNLDEFHAFGRDTDL